MKKAEFQIKPIHDDRAHRAALKTIETLLDAKPGTREAEILDVLSTLVAAYENEHHPIDPPDPIEAIKFRMEQSGLKQKDLAEVLGSRHRASEVLSGKRPLSLEMIRRLHEAWSIPLESLINTSGRRAG